MIRLAISAGVKLLANALGLITAAVVLDDVTITGAAFVIAVLIFTVVEVLADPLLTKISLTSVPALRGGVALVTTFLGLVITAAVSDGLSISGTTTWILATLLMWLVALAAALILPLLFVKKAVNNRQAR